MHRQSGVVCVRMVIFMFVLLMGSSTSGCIFISYGYLHRAQSNLSRPSETFHTRQISYPVLVTVYHMLECYNMDIFPLGVGGYKGEETLADKRQELFEDVEEEGWCLFSIDVRNTYGMPFEVTLERVRNGQKMCLECGICLTILFCRCYLSVDELYRRPRSYATVREFQNSTSTGVS